MLSIIDLVKAETLSLSRAAWLVERIEQGTSWLVGAKPGGAGKTTIMGALLAMLPEDETVHLCQAGGEGQNVAPGHCLVAYEISPGNYEGYIWGDDVAQFAARGREGYRLVANLHADDLEEAEQQIVGQCGATVDDFANFETFLPIDLKGFMLKRQPRVQRVSYVEQGVWQPLPEHWLPKAREQEIADFLKRCLAKRIHKIEDVRERYLAWCKGEWSLGTGKFLRRHDRKEED